MRFKGGALVVGALAVALAAAGCSETTNDGDNGGSQEAKTQSGSISYEAADNTGPAKAVEGATKGGTLTVMQNSDFEHLDPARNYVNVQQLTANLIYRSLNGYVEDGSGKMLLVGDLATNPGTDVNKDCKVWEFKLRDGLKYEDGSAISTKDVAWGIARSFAPELNEGPHYIQQWLYPGGAYNASYKGPYEGGQMPAGIETPDDKTIKFTFAAPHCDMPYAAALPTSAPVPQAKDTKGQYDLKPFSSGPYKVKSYTRDNLLELERNPNWDANTDPIRTAYPDVYKFSFGLEQQQIAERLVADAAADQASITWGDTPPAVLPRTTGAGVAERVAKGPTQYVWYLGINNQRIKDKKIREALYYGLDRDAALKAIGGTSAGTPASTLMSPTTAGFEAYDAYNAPATGDVNKVKEILGGTTPPPLVLAHSNTPLRTAQAEAIRASLVKAGFQVTLKAIEATSYYDEVGRKNTPFDLYLHGWGSDWPTGSTIIPPLYDSREIVDEGNQNLAYFAEPSIDAEIDRIKTLSAAEQDAAWMALDKKIMTEFLPEIPAYYDATHELFGSKVGNVFLSDAFGAIQLNKIYVKP
ncbi:peptide/nickel transport system substrate-binding protein [Asanoa hainanensis]|uniref:Peptide/nickel transport system substrate-binding protein n=1 Tax=Asanoa hainanensis TaxID=560556 RepID=A0A239I327_9ACTN|nr:ABC transporter substrate-binding protein [Asanoa hainanensis]SNS87891.1 peptide/nickel transport system substrate-binding protein [Asanoa hainanensis]